MNKILLFVLFLITLLQSVNGFTDNDEIVVLYLEAPLFFSKFGTLLANVNAFHSGLGFYSLNSDETYQVDFVAVPGVLESILPNRIENGEIIWNTMGKVQFNDTIDKSGYWSSEKKIMTINNEIFETFLCWAQNYNESLSYYELFDVLNRDTKELEVKSVVCNDFVWAGFNALYNLGGTYINESVIASRDVVTLYTRQHIEYIEDGSTNAEVVQFYRAMLNVSITKNQTINGLINELDQLFQGNFYLYVNGDYYNVTLDKTPFTFNYSVTPLPKGERDLSNVTFLEGCYHSPNNENSSGNNNNIGKHFIGGGWVFIIILVSFVTVYMVGGVLINKFKNDKSGLDLIPNKDSWSNLGGLISDGFGFVKSKITGSTSGGSGYSSI
ncbi:hypothetical protein RB653_009907 [Dictyostelium firmibasis]|uniref:Uncharacterized protein n=1 Tax=Dictyostelium firmibasis TaxID=79012 RepID=A0AAN7YKJ2_9MYCE